MTQTEVIYDRGFEIFTPELYTVAFRLVVLQATREGARSSQTREEELMGYRKFSYQTSKGTAMIRANPRKRTIELSQLVDKDLSNGIKKILGMN